MDAEGDAATAHRNRHTGTVSRRPRTARVSPVFLLLVAITVGGGILSTLDTVFAVTVGIVLLVLGGWSVSLCLHEFGHAAAAYRGGDTSVVDKGYLTLDIRRYTDPMLSFVLPLFFLLAGGIPLPGAAVWINDQMIRSPVARSLVSLAGPAVNLLLAIGLTALASVAAMPIGLQAGLSCLALIQVLAFLLNLLPVPGLDGFGALEPYLSEQSRELAGRVRPWAPLVLFLLIIGLPEVGRLFFDTGSAIFAGVGGNAYAASLGYSALMFWRR